MSWLVMLGVVGGALAVGGTAEAGPRLPTPVPSCPAGADTWTATTGSWQAPGNWSAGVPGAATYACILSANASVGVSGSATAAGVLLGTGATLGVGSGTLTLAGGNGVPPSAFQGPVTVASGAGLSVAAGALVLNATGGSISGVGRTSVRGTFEQDAGTAATGASDAPIELANGGALSVAGTGAGAFKVADSTTDSITVSLAGDLAAGQSFDAPAQDIGLGDSLTTVNAAASFANAGTITLDHSGGFSNSSSLLKLPSGATLTNTGKIVVSGNPAAGTVSHNNQTIQGAVDNQGEIDVGVSGKPAAYTVLPVGSTLTSHGTIAVASGSTLHVNGGVVNAAGGALSNAGTVRVTGSFEQGAGTVSGAQPVRVEDGSSLHFTGTGAGSFMVFDPDTDTITVSLSGDLAAGQSFDAPAQDIGLGDSLTTVNAAAGFTNAGTITLDHSGGLSNSSSLLKLPSGATLTNTGTIDVSGGAGQGTLNHDNRKLDGKLDNQGVLSAHGSTTFLVLPQVVTNSGSMSVGTGATVFTSAQVTNGVGGAITADGTVRVTGSFQQGAGTVSGAQPVKLEDGSSLAFTGAGVGSFMVFDPDTDTITMSLSGDLAAGQSLEVPGQDMGLGDSVTTVNAAAGFTNAGTITLDHSGGGSNSSALLKLPGAATLTNTGTIDVSGDPAAGTVSHNNQTIQGAVDNQGDIDVGVNGKPAAYTVLPVGSTLTSHGTIAVASGSTLHVSGGVINALGGALSVAGTVRVTGSFQQGAGTVSGAQPVKLEDGSSLAYTGTGAGSFMVFDPDTDTITMSLSGDLAAGQSLEAPAQDIGLGDSLTTVNAAAGFTNAGTITLDHSGGLSNSSSLLKLPNGATLTNTGTIDVSGGPGQGTLGHDNRTIDGKLDNQGTLNAHGSTTFLVLTQMVTNSGSIPVGTGATIYTTSPVVVAGGVINVDGAMHLTNVTLNGGVLKGAGMIDGNVVNNAGAIRPGNSPGTLSIGGNFTQAAGGTLEIDIAGNTPGTFDVLAVAGALDLAGTIHVIVDPSFTPGAGDSFQVITSGSAATTRSAALTGFPGHTIVYPNASPYGAKLTPAPTAVGLRSFSARRAGGTRVLLSWRTADEGNLLGFVVYRGKTRLNSRLIPARHAAGGAYAYTDRLRTSIAQARYRLEALRLDGSRFWLASTTPR
jgi:fibronectin-binding autotransporter adhesin